MVKNVFKNILKGYRISIAVLFAILVICGCIGLYGFYLFIQPVNYTVESVGEITKIGELCVSATTSLDQPVGVTLISPSGKEYNQSSTGVKSSSRGSTLTLKVLTAELGEWKVKYRNMIGVDIFLTRSFSNSDAAILIDTKATRDENNPENYIVSINMNNKNYTYTLKVVRRSDGFSLTSSGEGGTTLNLESYPYKGVWDFYLNTKRGDSTYSTMFSYTF